MLTLENVYKLLIQQGKISGSFENFHKSYKSNVNFQQTINSMIKNLGLLDSDLPKEAVSPQSQTQTQTSGFPKQRGIWVDTDQSVETENWLDKIPIIGDFLSDMVKYTVGGAKAGMTADESVALMKRVFGDQKATDEEVLRYIEAYNEMADPTTVTDEMQEYQRIYEEEGKGVWGVVKGLTHNPSVMLGLFLQSMSTQVAAAGSSKEVAGAGAAFASIGAGVGAKFGGIGAIPGAIAGAMGGIATGMEAALTFGELLKEEAGEGNFTLEGVRAVLNDPEKADSFVNKALQRGLTIGMIETLTGGIAGKATKVISRSRGMGLGTAAGLTTEAVGGSVGETAGMLAAGQELDTSEILLEGIIGKGNSMVNVLANLSQPGKYTINGEAYDSAGKFVEKLNLMNNETLRKAKINVENNDVVENLVNKKRQQALYDLAIGKEVTNIKDRKEIIKLEEEYAKVKDQTSVAGNIKATELRNKIKDILNKYKGGETTVKSVIKQGAYIRKVSNLENNLAKTKAFAKILGVDYKSMSNDEYVNFISEYNSKHKTNFDIEGEGQILQDNTTNKQVIVINKDVAQQSDQFTVGQHELLHALLHSTLKNNDATAIKLGQELEKHLDKINLKTVKDSKFKARLAAYKQAAKDGRIKEADRWEEVLTLTSEAMANNELKYDQTAMDKIADVLRQFLRKHFNVNIKLNEAEDVFNFIKDYNKSFDEGNLYKSFGRMSTKGLQGKLIQEPVLQITQNIINKNKIGDYNIDDTTRKEIVNGFEESLGVEEAVREAVPYFIPKIEAVVARDRDYTLTDLTAREIQEEKSDIIQQTLYNLILHGNTFDRAKFPNQDFDAYLNSYITKKFGSAVKKVQRKETKITPAQQRKSERIISESTTETVAGGITDKYVLDKTTQAKLTEAVNENVQRALKQIVVGRKPRQVKLDIHNKFRKEAIAKDIKNTIKDRKTYKKHLENNLEEFYNEVPISVLTKRFRPDEETAKKYNEDPDLFVKPAINPETGVQYRITKTNTSQPGVWAKNDWNDIKERAIAWHLSWTDKNGKVHDLPANLLGTRKDKHVQEISSLFGMKAANIITSSPEFVDSVNDWVEFSELKADEIIEHTNNVTNIRSKLKFSLNTFTNHGKPVLKDFFLHGWADPETYNNFKQTIINRVPKEERESFIEWLDDQEATVVPLDVDGWSRKQESWLKENDIDAHDLYKKDIGGKNPNGIARKQLETGIINLVKKMDPTMLNIISQLGDSAQLSFFGWEAHNLSKQDGKGMKKGDQDSINILNAIKDRINEKEVDPDFQDLGVEILDEEGNIKPNILNEIQNVQGGKLYGDIWNVLFTKDTNKKEKLTELKSRMILANNLNEKLFKYVNKKLADLNTSKNPIDRVAVLRIYKGTQNATSGFHRMFAKFKHVEVYEGVSQAPWVSISKTDKSNIKYIASKPKEPSKTRIYKPNTSHPLYKEAKVLSDDFNKKNAKEIAKGKMEAAVPTSFLKKYTEHLKENVFMLDNTYDLAKEQRKEEKDSKEYYDKLSEAFSEYDSSLNSHVTTLDMDNADIKGKKKRARTMGIGDKKLYYIESGKMKNIFDVVEGKPSVESIVDKLMLQTELDNLKVVKPVTDKTSKLKININEELKKFKNYDKAIEMANRINPPKKGASFIDFDDTLATTKSKIKYTIPRRLPDGRFNWHVVGWGARPDKGSLTPAEFAEQHDKLKAMGAKFDYSEFNEVKGGKKGPFFDKAKALKDKFGNSDIFIVTARPAAAAPAIASFLRGVGLNIKEENIIGLEDGRPEAKAEVIVDKAALGYNNFLFADDQIKNVEAVDQVLNSLDVEGKTYQVQQKFKLNLDKEFNKIIQENTGLDLNAKFSEAAAKQRGAMKNKFWKRLFIPPNAEDFMGLLYHMIGKGKIGERQKAFLKKALIDPFAKATTRMNNAKQRISNEYDKLRKQFPNVKKRLLKATDYNNFTFDQAIRVYIMNKNGIEIPGLSKRDTSALLKIVKSDPELIAYGDSVSKISRLDEGYITPKDTSWLAGTIESDLRNVNVQENRGKYLKEWIENKNIIFSKKNLNKIEATYGSNFREAMEDILVRMETGINRKTGKNRLVNEFTDWINNSVGAVMFLNRKSAILQTISFANFINWTDNNPLKFGARLLDFPQFAKDFAMIFNSNMLKQRRKGLQTDVSAADIVNQAANSKNKVTAMISYLLKKGFIFTQIADSFAIATGGAAFYRNRLNTYKKQGLSDSAAKKKAFEDFQETSEVSQQSARPDLISMQQASILGRTILSWQNTPMQYTRIMKKAFLDLVNRRGDAKTHVSKILYYGAVQNFIFTAMQQALFALAFSDEEEEEEKQRYYKIANGMADTILRGTGVYGAIASTLKNTALKFVEQDEKGWKADHTYTLIEGINVSPPLGSKARKAYGATQTWKFQKKEIMEKGFGLDNPGYDALAELITAGTNVPLDRVTRDIDAAKAVLDNNNESWQRIAVALGWPTWSVGIEEDEVDKKKKKKSGGTLKLY